MSLVVLQHVHLLGELAVALFALVLLDALVELHVVTQRMLRLHACTRGGGGTSKPTVGGASGSRVQPPRLPEGTLKQRPRPYPLLNDRYLKIK